MADLRRVRLVGKGSFAMTRRRAAFTLAETLAALVLLSLVAVEVAGMVRTAAASSRRPAAARTADLADTADRLLANPRLLQAILDASVYAESPAPDEPTIRVRLFTDPTRDHAWMILERDGATTCRWLPVRASQYGMLP